MAKRKNRVFRAEYSVLLVKPHNIEYRTDERVNVFCSKAVARGIAEVIPVPSKLPEMARNWAIDQFLNNPAHARKTHIFFLDADTCPRNDFAIEQLLIQGKDVIAGVTPIFRLKDEGLFTYDELRNLNVKSEDIKCMWSVVHKTDEKRDYYGIDELPAKPFIADRVGGTTLLISRRVLQKLKPPYQKTEYNETITGVKLSEDYDFCEKIKAAGFDIWVDPTCICSHYHVIDILDIFAIYKQSRQNT